MSHTGQTRRARTPGRARDDSLRIERAGGSRVSRTGRSRSSRPCSPAAASTSSARTVAERLGRALGQSFVVENQSGGGGIVGSLADRARGARRLHADGGLRRHARHQSRPCASSRTTRSRTSRRSRMVGGTPNVLVVPPSVPVNDAARVHRVREGEPGQALVRLGGPGLAHAPRDGAVQGRRPTSTSSHVAVSRHRPGDHRHPRRPDAGAVPGTRRGAAAHQGRQDAPARGHRHSSAIRCCPTCRRSRSWATRASTACSGTASSGRRTCRAPIVKRAQRRDQQAARRSRAAASGSPARRSSRCR